MQINPLLAYWTAVDLIAVYKGLEECPCDQIHIKYFDYPYPHRIAEDYFKAHKEYTHLILVPNDLIPSRQAYNKLLINAQKYDVTCGVCNVDLAKYRDYLNITSNLPALEYEKRRYRWISKNRYVNMILKVPFAGFPMMCVARHVLEKTRINWLSPQMKGENLAIWEKDGGYSNDLAFAYNLDRLGIPIMADTSINLLHLRYQGEKQIGKKKPIVEFIKYEEPIRA